MYLSFVANRVSIVPALIGVLSLAACGGTTVDLLNSALDKSASIVDEIGTEYTTAPMQPTASMDGALSMSSTGLSNTRYIGAMNIDANFGAGTYSGSVGNLASANGTTSIIENEYTGTLAVNGTFTYPKVTAFAANGTITGTLDGGATTVNLTTAGEVFDVAAGLAVVGVAAGTFGADSVAGVYAVSE